MTSTEALAALCKAVEHLVRCEIEGSIVECGVWRGGSMMAVAHTLLGLGVDDRDLYLFDTFEGMVPPTAHDVRVLDGLSAAEPGSLTPAIAVRQDEVAAALRSTAYPASRIHFVRGPVEDTLPAGHGPETIALLRLDTDWYESTRLELEYLYPRVQPNGFVIIDDYGHWAGARKAVDEYLEQNAPKLFLHRVDYTVRMAVKPRRRSDHAAREAQAQRSSLFASWSNHIPKSVNWVPEIRSSATSTIVAVVISLSKKTREQATTRPSTRPSTVISDPST